MLHPEHFLPVHGESEMKLFTQLIASNTSTKLDFEQMALDWVHKVDGVDVFPKLPVYLRTYYATWTRNQAAKNAMEQAKPAATLLQQVIEKTRKQYGKVLVVRVDSAGRHEHAWSGRAT